MFVFRTKFRWEETGCASAVSPSSCDSEIVISDFEMGKRECFRRNINARNQKSSPHPPPTPARKKNKAHSSPKRCGRNRNPKTRWWKMEESDFVGTSISSSSAWLLRFVCICLAPIFPPLLLGNQKTFPSSFCGSVRRPFFPPPLFKRRRRGDTQGKEGEKFVPADHELPLFFREKKKGNKVRACKFASVSLDPSSGHRLGPRLVAQSECRLIGPLLWCPINRRSQHSCFLISTYSTLFCSLL